MKHIIHQSPIGSLLFILVSGLFLLPVVALADSVLAEKWEITANKITRYENPPIVIAEGDVVLEKMESVTRQAKSPAASGWGDLLGEEETKTSAEGGKMVTETKTLTTIKADWMTYDVNLGSIKARGNVLIDIGPDHLKAESGVVDLNRETGTFDNATILRQYKDMHLEGRVVEKTGDLTYHIEDGWIVTCKLKEGQPPPWSFAAADAEITDGGYAFLKHATFRIKDVPVFYTPVMLLPAKRKRQTGFLFPSISTSDRDGFGVETPFFINLSPSSDITLYPRYLSDRGLMLGAELRYVYDQDTKGGFMANYLHDDLSDPSNTEYYREGNFTHTNQDRYWVRGKVDQDIGPWISRLDMDIVSDKDYLNEFNSGMTGFDVSQDRFLDVFGRGFENRTDQTRKNTLEILRSWDNGISLQGELLGINDLSEPQASPSPLWKLPAFNFTGLIPLYESGIDFAWDADYVHYWRKEGVTAQRVDLYPRISAAVPLSGYLETTLEAGVRDTFYLIDDNEDPEWAGVDNENRFLFDVGAEIGTTLMRDFEVAISDVNKWSHTFRPYIGYGYISDYDEDDLPYFDSIDSLSDENVFYYGIDNFFSIYGEKVSGKEYERDYGTIKIKQGYDFRSEESETPFTPVNVKIEYFPLKRTSLIYKTDIDVYGEGAYAHTVEVDYKNNRGDYLSADYKYNSRTEINSISGEGWLVLPHHFAVGYALERSIEDNKTIEEKFRFLYRPSCWSVELTSRYTPGDQTIMLMFRLANIGNPLGIDLPGF